MDKKIEDVEPTENKEEETINDNKLKIKFNGDTFENIK